MLLPDTTWGALRSIFVADVEQNTLNPDNLLAQKPEMYEESFKHEDDEYVWPDQADAYLAGGEIPDDVAAEELEEDPEAITAAGEPESEPEAEWEPPSPLYFTVAEDGTVLELVKMEDEGLFIRIESKWVDISDEDEFPTVYEQDMHFANDESVGAWDAELEDNDQLKLEDIQDYLIK
jgi:hypothetical protein